MRLRSARVATADREEPRAELPTVTTRESRKRAKSKKAEPIEANESPAGRALNAAARPLQHVANAQVSGRENVGPGADDPNSAAAEDMHMQPAESEVFSAEAADEAARMANALLSATPTPGRPSTSKDVCAAAESLLQPDRAWMDNYDEPVLPAPEDTYLQHEESPIFDAEAAAEAVQMAARHAMPDHEEWRKSGIWLGTADVQLGNIEQQWSKYKASSQRGWTLPKLDELHAKSKALETSGFTTVPSPKLRASSRSALLQAKPSNQLKRKAEEAVPTEELKKAAKTGPANSSPRRKLAVARTHNSTKATASQAAPSKKANSGEGFGKAAVKAGTPGKAAAAGSTAWAPSPSRFRRTTQENMQPAPTSRKVTGGWVK